MIWHNFHNCVSVAQYAISKNILFYYTFFKIKLIKLFASGINKMNIKS